MQTGVITKRGQSWVLRCNVKVRAADGKEIWKSKTIRLAPVGGAYRTEGSVRELADLELAKLHASNEKPTSVKTFARFIQNDYLPHVDATLKPSTAKGYKTAFRALEDHMNGTELRAVKSSTILDILERAANGNKLAHTTHRNFKNFLSGAWNYAKVLDLVEGANPCDAVKVPKGKPTKDTHAYSFDETKQILAAVPMEHRTMILLFAFTGLRVSEVKGLRWSDFDGESIHVRRAVWSGRVMESTKTEGSAAAVPLPAIVIKALTDHRKKTHGDSYIFHGRRADVPLRIENVLRREIKPALEEEQITWHGWHAFRRGVATNLHDIGTVDKDIQRVLRHSDIRTTMNIYVRQNSEKSREAIDGLEDAYRAKKSKAKKTA